MVMEFALNFTGAPPLPHPRLSSRHSLLGPNALTVQSAGDVTSDTDSARTMLLAGNGVILRGYRRVRAPMGPGDKPRDDTGGAD